MRDDFAPEFAALLDPASHFRRSWWSVKLALPSGDLWLTERGGVPFTGETHHEILRAVTGLGSAADRTQRTLQINETEIAAVNLMGGVSAGRLSDRFDRSLQARFAAVYLNLLDADGTPHRELMAEGVIRRPTYSIGQVVLAIRSLLDHYLSGDMLRTISLDDFPFALAVSETIPLVIGTAERVPGRIVKGRYASTPRPATGNSGTASLSRVDVGAAAVQEAYTLSFTNPETVEHRTGGGNVEIGARGSTDPSFLSRVEFSGSNQTNYGWVHTVESTASGMLVAIANTGQAVGAVRCGPVAQGRGVRIKQRLGGGRFVEVWWIDTPPVGAQQVVVNLIGQADAFAAVSMTIRHGRTPSAGSATSSAPFAPTTSSELDLEGLAGELAADVIAHNDSTPDFTIGAGQTNRLNESIAGKLRARASTEALGGPSVAMSWTAATPVNLVHAGAVIRRSSVVGLQKVTLSGAQSLVGVRLRLRRNQAYIESGLSSEPLAILSIRSDTGSTAPTRTTYLTVQGSLLAGVDFLQYVDVLFVFPGTGLSAGDNWLCLHSRTDENGNGAVRWAYDSVGAGNGAYTAETGSDAADPVSIPLGIVEPVSIGGDFWHELLFDTTAYSVEGSVTGADGAGSIASDFTSSSGNVLIPKEYWSGFPAGGDVFTWLVDLSVSRVIFAESPQATPCKQFGQIYADDAPIEDHASIGGATIVEEISAAEEDGSYVARITIDDELPDGITFHADLSGITDDTDGTYTGSPSSLIRVPPDVVHFVARRAGVPTERIDLTGSFATTAARCGSLYRFAGSIVEQQSYKRLLIRAAFEAQSVIDWPRDKLQMKFLVRDDVVPVKTITLSEIVREASSPLPSTQVVWGDASRIVNVATARWKLNHGTGEYSETTEIRDAQSVADYGELRNDDLFTFLLVRTAAHLEAVANFWLSEMSFPPRTLSLILTANHMDLELDDLIAPDFRALDSGTGEFPIDLTQPNNLLDAFDGLAGAKLFRIVGLDGVPDVRQVQVDLQEVGEPLQQDEETLLSENWETSQGFDEEWTAYKHSGCTITRDTGGLIEGDGCLEFEQGFLAGGVIEGSIFALDSGGDVTEGRIRSLIKLSPGSGNTGRAGICGMLQSFARTAEAYWAYVLGGSSSIHLKRDDAADLGGSGQLATAALGYTVNSGDVVAIQLQWRLEPGVGVHLWVWASAAKVTSPDSYDYDDLELLIDDHVDASGFFTAGVSLGHGAALEDFDGVRFDRFEQLTLEEAP